MWARASKEVAMASSVHHAIPHQLYTDRLDTWLWRVVLVVLVITGAGIFAGV
jgi:hypothetical protein